MEARLRKIELTLEQQGFLLHVLMIVVLLDTASVLVLWGQSGTEPVYDHIAISLTVFQMLLGGAAVFGFWTLRGITREKAEEVAEAEVRKILPAMVLRYYMDARDKLDNSDGMSDAEIAAIMKSMAQNGNGENGK